MRVVICEDARAVDEYAGRLMVELIRKQPQARIGFATGNTPLGLYAYLIQAYRNQGVRFKDIEAFNLDEYVGLARDHPQSFASFMQRELFSQIDIPASHIHALDGASPDPDQACQAYEMVLQKQPLDMQILGIGMDGHIGYNEPGSPLDGPCHVVDLEEQSIESSLDYGFQSIADVPRQGMTMGVGTIMQAKRLLMMAKGEKKAPLVKRMLEGEVSENFPASVIQRHPNVIVVLDRFAASELKGEGK